jgi:hypothetical protein
MEVSDTMILLTVDSSSLFLANKTDLKMRSQRVLSDLRKTETYTTLQHIILSNEIL